MSRSRALLALAVTTLTIAIDQVTKSIALDHFVSPHHVLWRLDFALVRNRGAAFGLGAGLAPLLVVVGLIAVLVVARHQRLQYKYQAIALGLVLGGALSNVGDRLCRGGAVVDFIDFGFWPAFNVADTAIFCGVCIYLVCSWCRERREKAAS